MFFKTKLNGHEKTLAMTSLHTKGDLCPDDHVYIGGGVYQMETNGRYEWTGEAWGGAIPLPNLIRWAMKAGYFKIERIK